MTRSLPIVVALLTLAVACGKDSAPSAPTPPAATRIIAMSGDLNFGDVEVGNSADKTLLIRNDGNSALIVTNMNGPFSEAFTTSFTNGTIAAGTTQNVTIRFTPTAAQDYAGTLTINANHTSGANTIQFAARGIISGPRTTFGGGQYRVGAEVVPGRYFTNPSDGCYWVRQSGFGGTLGEIIANEFIGFDAWQWIVDIKSSDVAFETDVDCGSWSQAPVFGLETTIRPGMWLVGAQIPVGTYRSQVTSGCYWERKRAFSGEFSDIIANDFISSDGQRFVTIRSSDAGFQSDDSCGTWVLDSSSTSQAPDSDWSDQSAIRANKERARQKYRR